MSDISKIVGVDIATIAKINNIAIGDIGSVGGSIIPHGVPGIDEYTKLMLHMEGDQSDSQHAVTVNGNPQLSATTAKFNGSMYFDGNGDYLSIPTSNDFSFGSGDFTVDFWIRFISPTDLITPIIGQVEDGSNRWHFVLNNNTGVNEGLLLFSTYSGGANMIVEAGSWFPNADTWYHIALVRSGGIIKIYVNGESQALSINNNPDESIDIDSGLYIGDRGFDEFGNIYVDEFRISKGIARWTSDFSGSLPSVPYTSDADTKLLLHMNGDVSNSAHTVTVNGNPQLSATTAKFDGSMYFDGNGDYLSLPESEDWNFGTLDFTIDFWLYITALPNIDSYYMILQQYEDSNNIVRITLSYSTGSLVRLNLWRKIGGTWAPDSGNFWTNAISFSLDSWHHVAFVKNSTNIMLFLDGDLSTNREESVTFPDLNAPMTIGQRDESSPSSYNLNGYLDEFRISKGIARWTANFTPPVAPYS